MEYKTSDVIKALKNAGYKAVTIDDAIKGRQSKTYYIYRGALHIVAEQVSFSIENVKDVRMLGKYHTGATDNTGGTHEVATDSPELFLPRLFGLLNGKISEAQIIAEVCN